MSKERAIALLGTAKNLLSPEDMRRFIDSALVQLRTDVEPIEAMEIARDMIEGSLMKLSKNLPDDRRDSPEELAEKFTICEAALLQIKEYAAMGLKARTQGSMDVAEVLCEGQVNHSLDDYSDTKVTITSPDGQVTETTAGRFNEIAEAVQKDPSIVDRVLAGGE